MWLLPLLVLRAFVPAGFMFSAEAGRLLLTFCPSVSAPQFSVDHTASEHAHGQAHDASGDGAQHHHNPGHEFSPCPFSLTATGCVGDLAHIADLAVRPTYSKVLFESVHVPTSYFRADRIRGPPSLA
jgi:hypothetical protein